MNGRATRDPVMKVAVVVWFLVLTGVVVKALLRPHAQSVFTNYWKAGAHWLQGETLYSSGSAFLYPPIAAAWFAPFALLPLVVGAILWRVLTTTAFFWATWTGARRILAETPRAIGWGMLALVPLALGNINNGQAGILVAALMVFSLGAVADERWQLVAVAMAVAAAFKIYPLALGLLLVVFYPRQLLWRLIVWVAGLFALSLVLQHPAYALAQYQEWFAHLGGDERRLAETYGTWRDAWLILRVASVPMTPTGWLVLQALMGLAAAALCFWGRRSGWGRERCLFAALSLSSVWMTLFGPATESSTYVLLAPAVTWGLVTIWATAHANWLRAGMTLAYGLLVGANMINSWISPTRYVHLVHLVQPVGALVFLITAMAWLSFDSIWEKSEQNEGRSVTA